MATEGRHVDAASAAATVESANFVRIVTRADGDGIAASGVLARALSEAGRPFQVTVGRTVADRTTRAAVSDARDDEVTIVIGPSRADSIHLGSGLDEIGLDEISFDDATVDRPITLDACDLVDELGSTPDPILALAGAASAGVSPDAGETEYLLDRALDADRIERRPGVAVPTADPIDGLAHSTRCLAPWSGDPDATREALSAFATNPRSEETSEPDDPRPSTDDDHESLTEGVHESLTEDAHRRLGSIVALDVVGMEDAPPSAATAVGTLLRPYATPDHQFETVRGFADVLSATARSAPGTGVALAMGHDVTESALNRWREHGRAVHEALDGATTGRYDGLFVVGIDSGPVETVAELAVRYRSPEPTVLAIGDGDAALATLETMVFDDVDTIASELDGGTYDVAPRRAYLAYDPTVDDATVIAEVRSRL